MRTKLGNPDVARASANSNDLAMLPSMAVKRASLLAEVLAVAQQEGLEHWVVDDLMTDDHLAVEGGIWLPTRGAIRLPAMKKSVITMELPIQASKLAFVYLDCRCADELALDVKLGGKFKSVGFARTDALGHVSKWASDLVTAGSAGDVTLRVTYDRTALEDSDHFLGYGVAWS